MKHALVTGGEGFIGSHLARRLVDRGCLVTVVDLPSSRRCRSGLALQGLEGKVPVIDLDLAEAGACERILDRAASVGGGQPVDAVFHLAAQTIVGEALRDPIATYEANVAGTWRLLDACRDSAVETVVVASSDKAYGPSERLPYREDQVLDPTSPYEASKAACELIARSHGLTYGLPVAVTRLANVYGGGDVHRSRLVPEAITAVLRGRDPVIRSDGTPERDFLHVSDAVEAYVALATALAEGRGRGQAFNAGTGRPVSVRHLLRVLADVVGIEIKARFEVRPETRHEIDRQFVDATALTELTGWRPRIDLEQGLREAYEWYAARSELLPAT